MNLALTGLISDNSFDKGLQVYDGHLNKEVLKLRLKFQD